MSDIKITQSPIDLMEAKWTAETPEGTELELLIQFYEGDGWSDWQKLHEDIDTKEDPEETITIGLGHNNRSEETITIGRGHKRAMEEKKTIVAFILANRATKFQYKARLESDDTSKTPILNDIEFTTIYSPDLPREGNTNTHEKIMPMALAQSADDEFDPASVDFDEIISGFNVISDADPKIISREEWGADENLRIRNNEENESSENGNNDHENEKTVNLEEDFYEQFKNELRIEKTITKNENGEEFRWPIEIASRVRKFIIHHTATTKDLDNPKAAIRSIYYYHAIKRGWGDIGYNYIIDTKGNIYEGRAGGEKVVGAHAGKHNTGSIGIAVLGNYRDEEPPYEVIKSLSNLLGEKADMYGIDPAGRSSFRGKNIYNIIGHRDVNDTDCPGAKLYAKIPQIRKLLAGVFDTNFGESEAEYDFKEIGSRDISLMKPNSTGKITFAFINTGTETWNSETFLVSNQNSDAEGMIEFTRNPEKHANIAFMKESSVKPGETATFEVEIHSFMKDGLITFDVTPILSGKKKLRKYVNFPIYVTQPKVSYAIYQIHAPTKADLKPGETVTAWVKLQNTGDVTWKKDGDNAVRIGTVGPRDRESSMHMGETRIGFLKQEQVEPGEIGHFEFEFTAPKTGGTYVEEFVPVMENVKWMMEDKNLRFTFYVEGTTYHGTFISASQDDVFLPGEKKKAWVTLRNTGDTVWKRGGSLAPKVGVVKGKSIGVGPVKLAQKEVEPEEIGKFLFTVTAPEKEGRYVVYLRPRIKGKSLIKKPVAFRFRVMNEIPELKKEDTIRVKISFSGNPKIAGTGKFEVYEGCYSGKSGNLCESRSDASVIGSDASVIGSNASVIPSERSEAFEMNDKVEVRFENNQYILKNGSKELVLNDYPRFVPKDGTILRIDNFDNRPSWSTNTNDNQYRGILEVRDVDGELTVINELLLEDYLKGVAEPAETDPYEKIRALAILARTYAKYYIDVDRKFPGKPYDGSDDPGIFQRYLGYSYETRAKNMRRAVEETEDMVVTYEGKVVKTPYFHSSDGRTRSAEEMFGWTHTPYLQSVPDPYCEGYTLSGHGVGLSGCGSYGAAKAGKTAEEIIKYYYQGVEIETVDEL